MYEHRLHRLLPRREFYGRLVRHAAVALLILLFSLAGGMVGYHEFEEMTWREAFLNSAMLLGGMGPVGTIDHPAGQIFAGCYALYAGLVFFAVIGLVAAPIFHRILHRFHVAEEREQAERQRTERK